MKLKKDKSEDPNSTIRNFSAESDSQEKNVPIKNRIPDFAKHIITESESRLINAESTLFSIHKINEFNWQTLENYNAIIESVESMDASLEEFLSHLKYFERDILKQLDLTEHEIFLGSIIKYDTIEEEIKIKTDLDNCNISLIKIRKLIKLYETKIEENTKPASIHFTENANSKSVPESSKKIQWLKEDTLILYLFESLYKEGCISASDYDSSVDFIINNFLNRKGKPFKRKNLSQSGNNLLGNKNKEPRNAHKIKKIFDK